MLTIFSFYASASSLYLKIMLNGSNTAKHSVNGGICQFEKNKCRLSENEYRVPRIKYR